MPLLNKGADAPGPDKLQATIHSFFSKSIPAAAPIFVVATARQIQQAASSEATATGAAAQSDLERTATESLLSLFTGNHEARPGAQDVLFQLARAAQCARCWDAVLHALQAGGDQACMGRCC